MKKCNACGLKVDDSEKLCPTCGSDDLVAELTADERLAQFDDEQPYVPTVAQGDNGAQDNGNGHILAGVVGAFLFSLVGAALYFVIYQMGIIAGVCGLVMFILANFGYNLFAKTKSKNSVAGIISAVAATIVMIFVAEYLCVSFEIYQVFKEFDITIFDAIRATPEFLADPDVASGVGSDLLFSYIFGAIAVVSSIVDMVKERKKNARADKKEN